MLITEFTLFSEYLENIYDALLHEVGIDKNVLINCAENSHQTLSAEVITICTELLRTKTHPSVFDRIGMRPAICVQLDCD